MFSIKYSLVGLVLYNECFCPHTSGICVHSCYFILHFTLPFQSYNFISTFFVKSNVSNIIFGLVACNQCTYQINVYDVRLSIRLTTVCFPDSNSKTIPLIDLKLDRVVGHNLAWVAFETGATGTEDTIIKLIFCTILLEYKCII